MQYNGGKRVKKNANRSCSNNEDLILTHSVINPTIPADRKKDIIRSQINNNPAFWILLPSLVVNSDFSLSKIRCELYFTSKIAPIIANQNIMPPNGCGVIYPRDNSIKNARKNIKFQKLSLFNLALIKLCIIASGVIGIYYSYVNEKSFRKLCFFRDCTKRGKDTIKLLDNKPQRLNEAEENLEYAISNYIDNYPSPLKATLRNFL